MCIRDREITTTSITVTVPQGFNGGKVTMVFEGIAQPVESDMLQPCLLYTS